MKSIYNIQIDTHVHSVLSGHAWSTLRENILQAGEVGLKGFCVTEHSGAMPGAAPEWSPVSMSMLPERQDGLRIYRGLEADILSPDGTVCPSAEYLSKLEFCIASMHIVVTKFERSVSACTEAYLKALENPYITVLGHIDRVAYPCELEAVVRKAQECGKLIELNNASLLPARAAGHQNVFRLIELCRYYDVPVCVCSDAHYYTMVGGFRLMEAALAERGFPEELIANRTIESFESVLRKRRESIEEYNRRISNAEVNRQFVY